MAEGPFAPEVVAAVTRHMNGDHAADNLSMCRVLGHQPDATHATMTGMDPDGIVFRVAVDGRELEVRIAWETTPVTRADVRTEVVQLYRRATGDPG
jgi:putative heme iron utilization protein